METGLQYNRERYYDPGTGRWVSQDPLGIDAGDCNLYRYVSNRPDEFLDASGLAEIYSVYSRAEWGVKLSRARQTALIKVSLQTLPALPIWGTGIVGDPSLGALGRLPQGKDLTCKALVVLHYDVKPTRNLTILMSANFEMGEIFNEIPDHQLVKHLPLQRIRLSNGKEPFYENFDIRADILLGVVSLAKAAQYKGQAAVGNWGGAAGKDPRADAPLILQTV